MSAFREKPIKEDGIGLLSLSRSFSLALLFSTQCIERAEYICQCYVYYSGREIIGNSRSPFALLALLLKLIDPFF